MRILDLITKDINQNGYHINLLTKNKIGALYIFPMANIPNDCLACDGYVLKISDYNKLFLAIGNKFNTGKEAQDEFRIPDYNITGRFLQPGVKPGDIKESGLPNIKATWQPNYGWVDGAKYSGAFTAISAYWASGKGSAARLNYGISFDASRSNSLYGKSETVQPASQIVSVCIKYK